MRVKRLKCCVAAVLVFALLAAASVYAASMYRLSYVERFETNAVDIHIQEISAVEQGEDPDGQLADANRDLSYVPRIINSAADCYIRAKIDIKMDGNCEQPLGAEHIYGLSEDWVNRGEYFYYTKILTGGQHADLFEGLHIPEEWEYGDAGGFEIDVKAEAVQSANFKPDFNSSLPWGAVELKTVAAASGNDCIEATPVSSISDVEYDSAGGFQCNTSDLFDEFDELMPGDRCEKTVSLKNTSGNTLKASLKITAGGSALSERMNLKIFNDGMEIYSGTAGDADVQGGLSIAEIPAGKTGEITFRVDLPGGIDNSYANLKDDIIWELDVEEFHDNSVQTGDFSVLTPFAVIAAFALLLMICTAVRNRKERNETHN